VKPKLIMSPEALAQEPYAAVLSYPKRNEAEIRGRVEELHGIGVSAVEFSGKTRVYGIPAPILGKGYVGIVVAALWNGQRAALKILRVDADRPDLLHEAEMLQKANTVDVGPKLYRASKNFLLMQLIDGDLLPDWLKTNKDKQLVKQVLTSTLENCFRLDEIGLDHGELSKAPKHVIIDPQLKPWILDFETASDNRKPANVPAIGHFLFTSTGEVAQAVAETLGRKNQETVVNALKTYKQARSRESFEFVLKVCLA
jgi:putative serine/threonine protein kinase